MVSFSKIYLLFEPTCQGTQPGGENKQENQDDSHTPRPCQGWQKWWAARSGRARGGVNGFTKKAISADGRHGHTGMLFNPFDPPTTILLWRGTDRMSVILLVVRPWCLECAIESPPKLPLHCRQQHWYHGLRTPPFGTRAAAPRKSTFHEQTHTLLFSVAVNILNTCTCVPADCSTVRRAASRLQGGCGRKVQSFHRSVLRGKRAAHTVSPYPLQSMLLYRSTACRSPR